MNYSDIEWLHVEASTKCNASCPSCPRTLDGYGTIPGLIEQNLTAHNFVATINNLPNLKTVQFCGNYGDPIVNNILGGLINIVKFKEPSIKIQIHTNGSLQTPAWWNDLALTLTNVEHDVIFAIDGLKGTHEIYRQGTNYNKIIANATAFIKAGGYATWQFIPFKHNEKEILFVMTKSQQVGFKRFTVQQDVRLNKSPARHYKTGKEYKVEFWKNDDKVNRFKNLGNTIEESNCMHLGIKSLYLNANGDLYPCCYLDNVVKYKNNVTSLRGEILTNPHYICLEECSKK